MWLLEGDGDGTGNGRAGLVLPLLHQQKNILASCASDASDA
jgi:hypothetical protein